MPNWCENKLRITGDPERIAKFIERCTYTYRYKGEDDKTKTTRQLFSFMAIIPEPKAKKDCPKRYVMNSKEDAEEHHLGWDLTNRRRWFNWYDWHCTNWGCKWDCSSVRCLSPNKIRKEGLNEVEIWFDTPWAEPREVIKHLLDQEKEKPLEERVDLEFMWYEPGMCFGGVANKDEYTLLDVNEEWDEEEETTRPADMESAKFLEKFYGEEETDASA